MPTIGSLQDVFWAITGIWFKLKTWLELAVGVDDKALHLVGGVLLQLIFCAVFRLPLGSWRPWLIVCGLEVINEASDIYWSAIAGDATVSASATDLAMTMIIPTMLLVWTRCRSPAPAKTAPPTE